MRYRCLGWIALALALLVHQATARGQVVGIETEVADDRRTVLIVRLAMPLEPDEVKRLAAAMRRERPAPDALGLKFVFTDWPRLALDDAVARSFYAWKMFERGRPDVDRFAGFSIAQARSVVTRLTLAAGEQVKGYWLDPYSPLGLVALVQSPSHLHYLRLAQDGTVSRWRLVASKAGAGEASYTAAEAIAPDGMRFKADGRGSARLGVTLAADGTLREFAGAGAGLERRPWLVGKPFNPEPRDSVR